MALQTLDGCVLSRSARPARAECFEFYAKHFNTVEINNSFYRLPAATTFDTWRESSPRDFCYAVKASRFITHMKKLKEPESSSEKFFLVAERLEKKLGPILVSTPAAMEAEYRTACQSFSRRCRRSTNTFLSFAMRVGLSRKCLNCCGSTRQRFVFTISRR